MNLDGEGFLGVDVLEDHRESGVLVLAGLAAVDLLGIILAELSEGHAGHRAFRDRTGHAGHVYYLGGFADRRDGGRRTVEETREAAAAPGLGPVNGRELHRIENWHLTFTPLCSIIVVVFRGELAQLVERLHGMQEVTGSNPVFSTKFHPEGMVFFIFRLCFTSALSPPRAVVSVL